MKIPPIVFILGAVAAAGIGFKLLTNKPQVAEKAISPPSDTEVAQITQQKIRLRVDGSTSMVGLNQAIKDQFKGSLITLRANGTSKGINALLAGQADVAAVARDLTSEEEAKGLVSTKVGEDVISFVVSAKNPATDIHFSILKDVFSGQNTQFVPINRPAQSATRELVGKAFGLTTLAGKTLPRDTTTEMIRLLGDKGIGYATYLQVKDQTTAKVLKVDGANPEDEGYNAALRRSLYYVTKGAPTGDTEAWIKTAASVAQ